VRLAGPGVEHASAPGSTNMLAGRITSRAFLGDHYQYEVAVGDIQLIAKSPHKVGEGAQTVVIPPEACLIVGPEGDGAATTNEGEEPHA
jgi:TOBE domain